MRLSRFVVITLIFALAEVNIYAQDSSALDDPFPDDAFDVPSPRVVWKEYDLIVTAQPRGVASNVTKAKSAIVVPPSMQEFVDVMQQTFIVEEVLFGNCGESIEVQYLGHRDRAGEDFLRDGITEVHFGETKVKVFGPDSPINRTTSLFLLFLKSTKQGPPMFAIPYKGPLYDRLR